MNWCWSYEKEGKDINVILNLARFLEDNFPRVDGLVGADCDIMNIIIRCYDNGGTPYVPELLSDGRVNYESYMFKMIIWELGGLNAEKLSSGRLKFTDSMGFGVMEHLMAEGDKEVYDIVSKLKDYAAMSAGDSPLGIATVNRQWKEMSILFTLDDMNIRGYQIRYALEYTDGSVESCLMFLTKRGAMISIGILIRSLPKITVQVIRPVTRLL